MGCDSSSACKFFCVAWCFFGTPNSESRVGVPVTLLSALGTHSILLSCMASLDIRICVYFNVVDIPRKTALF